MNSMLMTEEDRLKELFNSYDFTSNMQFNKEAYQLSAYFENNIFILYFMQLLQFACTLKIMNCDTRDKIVESILQAIIEITGEANIMLITNYMFVITLYLRSKNSWDAFLELKDLTSQQNVRSFLNSALTFYNSNLNVLSKTCDEVKSKVVKLSNKELLQHYNLLTSIIKRCKNFTLDLKNEKVCNFFTYSYVHDLENLDFLSMLNVSVKWFCLEISIMSKIDAKSIILRNKLAISKEKNRLLTEVNSQGNDEKYENALKRLKQEYQRKLSESEKGQSLFNKKMDELEANFCTNHSDLSHDELEKAFDDYLDKLDMNSLDLPAFEDPTLIENWYQKEKAVIDEKFNSSNISLYDRLSDQELLLESSKIMSLKDIILEYALFSKATKGIITYPVSNSEKLFSLGNLSLPDAISEFLEEFNSLLSDEEIAYLQKTI